MKEYGKKAVNTAKGRAEHERVHTQRIEKRGDCVKLYEFTVYTDSLELLGKCDCIEANKSENGCHIPTVVFQYNYIRLNTNMELSGMKRNNKIQLCAQAMCLEEMFDTEIPEGALFFISSHRRLEIVLDESLRQQTRELANELHEIRTKLLLPDAVYSAKCRKCSLKELCMPKVKRTARKYCEALRNEASGEIEEETL